MTVDQIVKRFNYTPEEKNKFIADLERFRGEKVKMEDGSWYFVQEEKLMREFMKTR